MPILLRGSRGEDASATNRGGVTAPGGSVPGESWAITYVEPLNGWRYVCDGFDAEEAGWWAVVLNGKAFVQRTLTRDQRGDERHENE